MPPIARSHVSVSSSAEWLPRLFTACSVTHHQHCRSMRIRCHCPPRVQVVLPVASSVSQRLFRNHPLHRRASTERDRGRCICGVYLRIRRGATGCACNHGDDSQSHFIPLLSSIIPSAGYPGCVSWATWPHGSDQPPEAPVIFFQEICQRPTSLKSKDSGRRPRDSIDCCKPI